MSELEQEQIEMEEQTFDQEVENNPLEEDETFTITLKRTHIFALLLPIVFLLGLGSGYFVWGRETASSSVAQGVDTSAGVSPSEPQELPRYDVPVDDDPVLGNEDAPVTIIEFSDFECPFCTRFHNDTFSQIIENYGDEVRFVYRDFPLTSIHPEAFPAAEAANCAGEQGQYWEYHDKLFVGGPQALSSETYIRYAEELALDMEGFQECVETGRYREEVQADLDFAAQLGVRSTPTFFINGIAVVGAQPFSTFAEVIEGELNGTNP
ncbi:MAG: DsbA family protein [Chloroflexi bacterium]|nr:MAG: DsbA family protein [Chloroflexota bacterium]MBL1194936.1 DsbA family protein [Chloroflexota bacterium]NOH12226.1 DsbA family protein [Chloroflexota bacterium]